MQRLVSDSIGWLADGAGYSLRTGKDGQAYRTYLLLRGSSTYDTAEMKRLLDGLQSEARELGIEMIWDAGA